MWLFALFLLVPLIEIALFIQVGGLIGLWPTLGIVVATAVAGTWLVRREGLKALAELRRAFETLGDPGAPLAHGAAILLAGALLITPGFFTDTVGFLLLVPQVRAALFRWLSRRIRIERFTYGATRAGPAGRGARSAGEGAGPVIEGEWREVEPRHRPTHRPSGWTRH
ncbi:MAG: FxsA family protein [Rhodobacteraceae bacterium]|nr:FxsA family protein [Paracoccaceae bacterium]